MDMRTCAMCPKEFDFDTEGLEGPNGVVVCGSVCAKASAAGRGRKFFIHDHSGGVVETNVLPGESITKHHW